MNPITTRGFYFSVLLLLFAVVVAVVILSYIADGFVAPRREVRLPTFSPETPEPRNGVADRVTVIHKSSGALRPGVDLPDRGVDIVVTELVDSGLLGERIIPVLADARARGLLARGGRVIPEVWAPTGGIVARRRRRNWVGE